MKVNFLFLCGIALFVSCSTPRFAGQPTHGSKTEYAHTREPDVPFSIDEGTLVASISDEHVYLATPSEVIAAPVSKSVTLTREEKKELKREAIKQIKAYTKAVKNGDKALAAELKQAMDNDLKLAAVFGAVGIVSFIIGGDVFHVIGAIALIVGVVFFVKWLMRQ
ncbi:MAG: hypothetical protein HRU69_01950 [Flammeovirgaceae bacterium]|nr:MAG: hypothetical protein HRU69_01950 [Flammeovirgaceae bacterium]